MRFSLKWIEAFNHVTFLQNNEHKFCKTNQVTICLIHSYLIKIINNV